MVEITFFVQQKDLDNRPSHGAWRAAYYIQKELKRQQEWLEHTPYMT